MSERQRHPRSQWEVGTEDGEALRCLGGLSGALNNTSLTPALSRECSVAFLIRSKEDEEYFHGGELHAILETSP